jgi:hypothetical protein
VTKLIIAAGTWDGWDPPWIMDPQSPFRQIMRAEGFELALSPRTGMPFRWDSKLGGVPFLNRRLWTFWGHMLMEFADDFVYDDLNFLGLSHGGNIVIEAVAHLAPWRGVRTITTVGTPRRTDVPIDEAARNTAYWQHIISKEIDWTATLRRQLPYSLGGLGDGDPSLERRILHPNVENKLTPHIGHSAVVKKGEYVHHWRDELWFEAIRTCGGKEARDE